MANVDVVQIAKNVWKDLGPDGPLVVSGIVASAPIILAGLSFMAKVNFFIPVTLGLVTGLGVMGVFYFVQESRSRHRRTLARAIAQTRYLNPEVIRALLQQETLPSWITYQDFDKANWLNAQIKELWPYLNKAACQVIKEALTPILNTYKFGILKTILVKSFTLGQTGPRLKGVKVIEGAEDETVLEVEIDWRQGQDQRMVLDVETTLGPSLKVQLHKFQIYGVLHIIFKPLIDEVPGFGCVLFSLREMPEIDFEIKTLGGNLTKLPGIDSMIDGIIRTSLDDMLVWPSRMIFPMVPGDFSYLELRPVGYLDVTLIEGRDLPKTDLIGKTDPFVFLYVRQKAGNIKRSSTKANTYDPIWHEGFYIEVEDPPTQHLTCRVMDSEAIEKAEYVCAGELMLNKLTPFETADVWMNLVDDPKEPNVGNPRGKLHLHITYYPYQTKEDRDMSPANPDNKGPKRQPARPGQHPSQQQQPQHLDDEPLGADGVRRRPNPAAVSKTMGHPEGPHPATQEKKGGLHIPFLHRGHGGDGPSKTKEKATPDAGQELTLDAFN